MSVSGSSSGFCCYGSAVPYAIIRTSIGDAELVFCLLISVTFRACSALLIKNISFFFFWGFLAMKSDLIYCHSALLLDVYLLYRQHNKGKAALICCMLCNANVSYCISLNSPSLISLACRFQVSYIAGCCDSM